MFPRNSTEDQKQLEYYTFRSSRLKLASYLRGETNLILSVFRWLAYKQDFLYARLRLRKKKGKHFYIFTEFMICLNSVTQPASVAINRWLPLPVSSTYLSSQFVFVWILSKIYIRVTLAVFKFYGDFIVSLFTKRQFQLLQTKNVPKQT